MVFGLFKRQKNQNGKYKKLYYSIVSVPSERVIDVAKDGPNAGTTILWDGYAGENQQFTLVQDGPAWYIKCRQGAGDSYLTVQSDANGAKIFLAKKSKDPRQKFRIDQKKDHKEHIIYTFCGKVLDCAEGGKKNGTRVIQWDFNGGKNQLFSFCDPKDITSSSSDLQ